MTSEGGAIMSKELEALERIKKFYPTWRLSNRDAFNIVEKALKVLKIMKQQLPNLLLIRNTKGYDEFI